MRSVSATAIWQRLLLKSITQDTELNYPGLLYQMHWKNKCCRILGKSKASLFVISFINLYSSPINSKYVHLSISVRAKKKKNSQLS